MLNRRDNEVCLESGDAVRRRRVDQFFSLAPGQNRPYELAGHEIGKIARGQAAFPEHHRAGPIAPAQFHSNRFKLHYFQFTPPARRGREMPALSTPLAGTRGSSMAYVPPVTVKWKANFTMKWLKRLLILIALALLGVVAFSLVGVYLYRGTPKWYRPRIATTQQVKDAANRADQKLLDLFTWAASARAQQLRRINGISQPGDAPIGPKTVSFDDDEINSFAASWKSPGKDAMEARIAHYFTDGRVALQDDSLILVGQSPAFGTLASAVFRPSIDAQGNLHVDLDSLCAGLLPVPQSAISDRLVRLRSLLQQQLSVEQPSIRIDSAQTANGAALAASWLRLLLSSLNGRPADPVLIIPFDLSNLSRGFPVKLTGIKIVEGQITLTMEPLTSEDGDKLLEGLKQPPGMNQ
jgi:uncharacterized protein YpmS